LSDLPEPAGSLVAQLRAAGRDDAAIRQALRDRTDEALRAHHMARSSITWELYAASSEVGEHMREALLWLAAESELKRRDRAERDHGDAAMAADGEADLERELKTAVPSRRRGFKGQAPIDDTALVKEMRALMAAKKVPSPTQAAESVVDRAQGFGTESSRVTRLVKKYYAD
ncbi:MAG TPA: hypothetical protein VF778_03625, partial [Xanthobacteraceae bacterium]